MRFGAKLVTLALGAGLALAAATVRAVPPVGTAMGVTPLADVRFDELVGEPLLVLDLWAHDHPDGRRYVYVTTEGHGMFVVDVSDPAAPVVVTQYLFPGFEDDRVNVVKLRGTWAFVGLGDGGLSVLDVSDPSRPVEVAHLSDRPLNFGIHTLWVDGDWLYVATVDLLVIVDVSDPTTPVMRGFWPPSGFVYVHDLTVFDGRAYVASLSDGLRILDVSNPPNPVEIGAYDYSRSVTHSAWPNAARTHVLITDERCSETEGIVRLVDARSLPAMTEASRIVVDSDDDAVSVHQPFLVDDVAYMAWYREGLRVYDVSNPDAPSLLATFATYEGGLDGFGCFAGAYGTWADGCGLVYVADTYRGLWVLQVDAIAPCDAQPRILADGLAIVRDSCAWGGPSSGDGFVAPGEAIDVLPSLRNVGARPATGVVLDVAAFSQGIASATGSAIVSDVPPGATRAAGPGLQVIVSETAPCGTQPWIDLRVRTDQGTYTRRFTLRVGRPTVVLADDFSADLGWTASTTGTGTSGRWERVTPAPGSRPVGDDPRDAGDACWVTEDGPNDVDMLVVDLVSPMLDLSAFDAVEVEWSDWLWIEAGSLSWLSHAELLRSGRPVALLESTSTPVGTWRRHSAWIPAEYLDTGIQVRLRVGSWEEPDGFEAGVDDVRVTGWSCTRCAATPVDLSLIPPPIDVCDTSSDGVVQPGESVQLPVALFAASDRIVSDVSVAVVATTGAWMAIDTERSVGDVGPGAPRFLVPGLLLQVEPAAACGAPLSVTLVARSDEGDGPPSTFVVTTGAVMETVTPLAADDFDAAVVDFVPPGWSTATTDAPSNDGTRVDDSIEPALMSPGAPTGSKVVRIGPLAYPRGATYDYDLSRVVDASGAPGDALRIRFSAWFMELESDNRFSLRARDVTGVDLELWSVEGPLASVDQDLCEWRDVVVDVDPTTLDLSQPITLTWRAHLDSTESGGSGEHDAVYVDSVAIASVHRVVTCTPCANVLVDALYRLDVTVLRPPDPGDFLDPPRGDGISLDLPPYAPMNGSGPEPRDPAVLTNGVPLSFYQVARRDGSPSTVRISKYATTIRIDY